MRKEISDSGWASLGRAIMAGATIVVLYGVFWLGEWRSDSRHRLENLDSRVMAVESRLLTVETRMGTLETRMDSMESRMGALETEMRSTRVAMENLTAAINK